MPAGNFIAALGKTRRSIRASKLLSVCPTAPTTNFTKNLVTALAELCALTVVNVPGRRDLWRYGAGGVMHVGTSADGVATATKDGRCHEGR
jgi:hypothetical protein